MTTGFRLMTTTAVVFVSLFLTADVMATVLEFNSEADFLAAVPGAVEMESFEYLPADNVRGTYSELTLPGFRLVADSKNLSVWSMTSDGHATDGSQYVAASSTVRELDFHLNKLTTVFGLNITDWGDWNVGTLTFSNHNDALFTIAVSPLPAENELFFGVISSVGFDRVTVSHDISGEAYAIDEVYYQAVGEPNTPLPLPASNPDPSDSSENVPVDTCLSWAVSGAGGSAVGTVEILMFTGYADTDAGGEVDNTLAAISEHFTDFNVTRTTTQDAASLALELSGKGVFLVPEQEHWTKAQMEAWGADVAAVLNDFATAGGVIVVADDGDDGDGGNFVNSTGLMAVGSKTGSNWSRRECTVELPEHPLMNGVPVGFNVENGNTSFSGPTNGIILATVNADGNPIVLARKVGIGGVVLIGCDYFRYNSDIGRIIANAVRWGAGTGSGPGAICDLYIGTDPGALDLVAEDLGVTSYCAPGPYVLGGSTQYFWQVVTKGAGVEPVPGPIWSFTTGYPVDLNNDGVVDIGDFDVFVERWLEAVCTP